MLAQELIDQHAALPRTLMSRTEDGRTQLRELDRAFKMLCPPWEGNHVVPAHPSLATVFADEAARLAQPIVFERDLFESACLAFQDKESFAIASKIAQLPYSPCMIEYVGLGFLIAGDRTGFSYSLFGRARPGQILRVFCHGAGHGCFDPDRENGFAFAPASGEFDGIGEKQVRAMAQGLLMLCAFTTISGTTMRRLQTHNEPQQRKRMRANRPALLSYNVVSLKLPARRDLSEEPVVATGGKGVRFHQRIGYLRISRHGDPQAHFTWVPAKWLGNRELGTVLKTRHASLSERTQNYIAKHGTTALKAINAETAP